MQLVPRLRDTQRKPHHQFAIDCNINMIDPLTGELEPLKVENEIASQEGNFIGHLNRHVGPDGHLGWINRIPILVDDVDRHLVITRILGKNTNPHGQGTVGMYDRKLGSPERIERSIDDQFAVSIVGGEIAEGCYLNIH